MSRPYDQCVNGCHPAWIIPSPWTQQSELLPFFRSFYAQRVNLLQCVQGDLEFNVEVSIMAGLRHPNVLPLLGSCCEADQRVAVFAYVPHGNLRDLLDSKTPAARHFNWPARLNVLLGVAKGLEYLHDVSPLQTPASLHCLVQAIPLITRAKTKGAAVNPAWHESRCDCRLQRQPFCTET